LKALDYCLQHFLQELVEPMGRSERRHWARVYVQGLMLDGERKSIEPLAARQPGADVQAHALEASWMERKSSMPSARLGHTLRMLPIVAWFGGITGRTN
jgi:SRSO17 transposase